MAQYSFEQLWKQKQAYKALYANRQAAEPDFDDTEWLALCQHMEDDEGDWYRASQYATGSALSMLASVYYNSRMLDALKKNFRFGNL